MLNRLKSNNKTVLIGFIIKINLYHILHSH